MTCRECGCWEYDPCWWVEIDLCSFCANPPEEEED